MEKGSGHGEDEDSMFPATSVDDDPKEDIESLKQIATSLINEERYEEAIGYLDLILKIRPDNEEILASKGFTFCLLGNFDEGLNFLKEAFKLNPASKYVLIMAADAYLRCGRPDNSVKLLEKGIDLYPEDDGLAMLKEIILMTKFNKKEYISVN